MEATPERMQLLRGPYRPPRVRADGYLRCAMRGRTKVDGYTTAPIPWPAKWGRSPILCGDLIRAVRHEAKPTLAYHWGVSIITVYKWRKCLGVKEWNEGSSQLLSYARTSANAVHGHSNELVMAANPRRRNQEFRGLMREITRRRLKKVGAIDPERRRPWSKKEDEMLGAVADDEVAARTGRTRQAVLTRRLRLHKKSPTFSWTLWAPEQLALLGTMTDQELSKRFGRSVAAVAHKRHRLRILWKCRRKRGRAAGSLGDQGANPEGRDQLSPGGPSSGA